MYRSSTESSEAANEDFAALRKSPGAPLEASEVATEYTIAIQKSPETLLEASEVATEYAIVIQQSPGASSWLPKEQWSVLRLHSPVPEDSQKVYIVYHSKSISAISGGSWSFWNQTIDFADATIC
ncbi:hypothetical protein K440DRAFT_644004 [Wilcoxina mikolae CBS 423.85]|nr:hypothetical protein K440DRAFT_644004 [Wilcoxina mikolae CBS 423.85]